MDVGGIIVYYSVVCSGSGGSDGGDGGDGGVGVGVDVGCTVGVNELQSKILFSDDVRWR